MIPGLLESIISPELERFNKSHSEPIMDPTFIPVHLTGGVGDVVISLDAVKWLHKNFDIVVYCHHIEAFKHFLPDIPCFKVLPSYSWVLEFNTIAKFHTTRHFPGFLIKDHEELFNKQRAALNQNPRLESLVHEHFNRFFLISIYAKEFGLSRRQFPMHTLGLEDAPEFEFYRPTSISSTPIITIHDGYDIHNKYMVTGRATKQWKWEHWNQLVGDLKSLYPGYKIIQLGAVTGRQIDGVDQCLLNKTSITEAIGIISRSSLHIDGDSGLAHIATRFQVPTVVMWGPTPMHFYAYPQNINLTANVCRQPCYGVRDNWMDKCVIGYPAPKCMDEVTPGQVLSAIYERNILCQNNPARSAIGYVSLNQNSGITHVDGKALVSSLSASLT